MIERIIENENTLAIIIRSTYKREGIEFFTPGDYSQQLGYMKRPSGYIIEPHFHKLIERKVTLTQEVLFIKSGIIKVNFYWNRKYISSSILQRGDVILLACGGHGFEVIDEAEMIEVKQGPYFGDEDKVRFTPLN